MTPELPSAARTVIMLAILVTGTLFSGACSCRSQKDHSAPTKDGKEIIFATAPKASLKLERGFKQLRYEAGTPGQKMQFKLSNAMLDRPVSIEEWFARDDENIKIFVAPCEKGASASVRKEDWKQIHPYIVKKGQKNRKHNKSPVTLNPNNAVLLEVDLKFLENYKLGSKPSQNLAVRAELDLLTVEAAADIFEIEIIPSLHAEILSGDEE